MSREENCAIVMEVLRVIEDRELDRLGDLYHPDVEFHWPPGLPYSGSFKGESMADMGARFAETWLPLQPTEETRRMDAKVVATDDNGRVIVRYTWKGLDTEGRRLDADTLADYQVRDGRLARAQMYYFDLTGMISFLETARQAA
jgi:ketosteroid isomerase-like protein